jgi:hypothetical protein
MTDTPRGHDLQEKRDRACPFVIANTGWETQW